MPIFGICSIAVPFLGVGLACVAFITQPRDDESWAHAFLGMLLILASLICGMYLAIIAKYRNEKPALLSWFGFLLNTIPLLFFLLMPFLAD